ncbi:hypothetical protein ACJIZ3_007679 [Penstemon smallii]|uniref:Uncharacterized protein n=1 Tax=Penstemon smallii TaxID=265156 RepID=A0ABD3T8L8_9LAMI
MAASFGSLKQEIFDKQSRKQQYQDHIRGLNAYDRHKKFLNDYVGFYGKQRSAHEKLPVKTDQDTLREGYRFIRTEEDDMHPSWEQRLDSLYVAISIATKEMICQAMRQVSAEFISISFVPMWEVNFSYSEAGENKQALVKLVTCERCAEKLLYKKRKEKERLKQKENDKNRRKRDRSDSGDDSDFDDNRSKGRRKGGKKVSTELDDENFDEYLEGMFP